MEEPGGALYVLRGLAIIGTFALALVAARPAVTTAQSVAWELVGIVRNLDGSAIPGATAALAVRWSHEEKRPPERAAFLTPHTSHLPF